MSASLKNQIGVSLIEVLIALLIFTVGLLGLAAMQLNALQSTSDSAQRSQAAVLLQDISERIRANPRGSDAEYAADPACAALPEKMCADHFNPATNAKVNAEACSSTEMAAFDAWEASCSYAQIEAFNAIGARFNSRDFLSASSRPVLDITATANGLSVTSNWLSKANYAKNKDRVAADQPEHSLSAVIQEIRR